MSEEFRFRDAALAGMVGALAVTAVHQVARRVTLDAPRMDVLGERALTRGAHMAELPVPSRSTLHRAALAGDIVFNSAYYSLASSWTRGLALGLAAGVGALVLPQRMGLGDAPRSERLSNQVMTVAWYVVGGLAAAATSRRLAASREQEARTAGRWESLGELGYLRVDMA